MPFELALREALAAPTAAWQAKIQSTVIVVVSTLSLLGAGWIMISFACFKSLRTFRHQLILGLAVSDFIMALNFLLSASVGVGGRDLGDASLRGFCSFNGFMTQVFVIQTDYWVLLIAFCTYLILADHKGLSTWIQDRRLLIACLPWLLSILWSVTGLAVTGYGNIGAWCWFTSDEVRLLVNFVPRWLIILLMLSMYARLYYVLRGAHRRFVSFDRSSEPTSHPRSRGALPARPASAATGSGGPRLPQGRNKSSRRLKRLARLMIMYPVAYMLVWTLPTCIRIYQATQARAAPFALQTADKSCIVIQGLVDAIIYGLNESSLASWRNLLWPQAIPIAHGGRGGPTKAPRIPSARLGSRELDGSSTTLDRVPTADAAVWIHATPEQARGEAVELASLPRAACGGLQVHKTAAVAVAVSRPGSGLVDRHGGAGGEHMYH